MHFWNAQDSGAKERVGERRPNILNSYPYCWYLCIHACFSKFHSCKVSFAGASGSAQAEAALDTVDTQPVDVTALQAPAASPLKLHSPEISSNVRRKQYQYKTPCMSETRPLDGAADAEEPDPAGNGAEQEEEEEEGEPMHVLLLTCFGFSLSILACQEQAWDEWGEQEEEEQEEDEEPEEQEEQDDQEEQEEAPEDDDVLLREHQLKNKKGKAKKNDGKGEKPKGKGNKAKAKEKTEKKETGGVRKKPAMSNRSAASSSKPKSKPKRTAAKSAASPKNKGKSKKPQTKPASEKSQPPMKRVRTKSSPQEEDMYCKHMYTEIKGYVEKFTTEDAGEQFKRKAKHFCNFQLLHCSLEPYYTRQSCLVSVGADMTESGKPLTWSFSFSGKDEKMDLSGFLKWLPQLPAPRMWHLDSKIFRNISDISHTGKSFLLS